MGKMCRDHQEDADQEVVDAEIGEIELPAGAERPLLRPHPWEDPLEQYECCAGEEEIEHQPVEAEIDARLEKIRRRHVGPSQQRGEEKRAEADRSLHPRAAKHDAED